MNDKNVHFAQALKRLTRRNVFVNVFARVNLKKSEPNRFIYRVITES